MRTTCEFLARAGFETRVVATTASEKTGKIDPLLFLRESGMDPEVLPGRTKARVRPEYRLEERGVHYRLIDTGPRDMHAWQKIHGGQFDRMFDDELSGFQPDIVMGFGGLPQDVARFDRARRSGAKVVFALRNRGYLQSSGFLKKMDGILTPSEFLTRYYRTAIELESTPLPVPMEMGDVVAEERDPIFVTVINPSPEKGVMVVARLAEELSGRRPDIAMLIVESRGSAGQLVRAGMAGGFDLRRHENLMFSPAMAQPKEIYVPTKTLLAPSLWQEAAGRVAAEALLNGIPPLVSDRGGLAETCNGAGFYLPIPPGVTAGQAVPVAAEVVEPWIDLIERLEDDAEFYRAESERALAASTMYRPENLAPRYVEYFRGILGE